VAPLELTRLAARAPGKVNVCLFVGAPRPDGLHPLVSVVQPVTLADELVLEPHGDGDGAGDGGDFVVCPGVEGENLAARALAGFRAATGWDAPPVRLSIAKRVPVAAGMGGGSGDAAAALRLAAAASGRPIPAGLPMALGADVPSQLDPGRVLMTGAGEHVERLPEPPPSELVIVPLDAALPTPAVYRAFDELGLGRSAAELAELDADVRRAAGAGALPRELVRNDLEAAARHLCPAIDPALELLRGHGAAPALVSGSGPTVFGLFAGAAAAEAAAAALRAAGHPRAIAAAPAGPGYGAVRAA
jgi:4-diphosphocytidyl-2-C-methyl-D-erythritol kinase